MEFFFFFSEMFQVQSAFYRPTPTSRGMRHHGTSTPYSDALKAAAVLPHRVSRIVSDVHSDPLSLLRTDYRASMPPFQPIQAPSYWYNPMVTAAVHQQFKISPPPPSPPASSTSSSSVPITAPIYPIVYKPKIISPTPDHDDNIDTQKQDEEPDRDRKSASPERSDSESPVIDP